MAQTFRAIMRSETLYHVKEMFRQPPGRHALATREGCGECPCREDCSSVREAKFRIGVKPQSPALSFATDTRNIPMIIADIFGQGMRECSDGYRPPAPEAIVPMDPRPVMH